jgi:UDP-glucose 4-epimerase
MRVYITGIAGFIGSHLAKALKAQGHMVGGCDNLVFSNGSNLDRDEVSWTKRDVMDLGKSSFDWSDPEVIVHLAAVSCSRHPNDALVWRNNLRATSNLLTAAQGRRIVFASTCLATKPETGAYAASKWACEQILHPENAAILRLANVYGPKQRDWGTEPSAMAAWRKAEAEGKPIRIDGDGTQTRDFIHVDDVVRAFSLAVANPQTDGKILDICTGHQTSINDASKLFEGERVYGRRPHNDPDATWQYPQPAEDLIGFKAEIPLFNLSEAA